MKKRVFVIAGIVLAVLVMGLMMLPASTIAASKEKPIVWKVQTPWPPALWHHKSAQIWAEDIYRLSGGRMKIDLHATDEIVPAFEIYDSVRVGTLDAGHTWSGYVIGKFPAATFFAATPAFIDLLGYFTWMYQGGGKELWQEMYGNNVVVMPAGMLWAEGGGWANKMIQKLSDFKGLKYRTVLIWGQILSEAGASVVTLPAGEIVPSLQRGTLDAAEFSTPVTDLPLGFHEVSKYSYFPGLHQIAGFLELMINPKKWKALPDDLKQVVIAASDMAVAHQLTAWIVADCKSIEQIQASKAKIVKFPKQMQQEILDKFVAKYNAQKDPHFQKVWKSQKNFLKLYAPYMKLQSVEAEVDVNK
jgi:TRAP-type mannitol/chloroaromatic compound transport system substrate-binding protein